MSDTHHEQRNEPAGLVPADTNDDTPRQHPTNSTQTAAPALDVSASPSRRGSKRNGKDGPKSKASVSSRSTTTTSSAGLSASVASSPRYRIAAMSLEAEGLETRQASLNDPRAPRALSDMLAKIYRWSNHRSIIGSALKNPVSGISDDLRTAWLLEDDVFSTPTSFAGDSGSTVSPQHVLDLLQNACDCYTRGDSEIGWNFEVHHKLLRMVLRSSPQPRLLDFSAWYVQHPHWCPLFPLAWLTFIPLPVNLPRSSQNICLPVAPTNSSTSAPTSPHLLPRKRPSQNCDDANL